MVSHDTFQRMHNAIETCSCNFKLSALFSRIVIVGSDKLLPVRDTSFLPSFIKLPSIGFLYRARLKISPLRIFFFFPGDFYGERTERSKIFISLSLCWWRAVDLGVRNSELGGGKGHMMLHTTYTCTRDEGYCVGRL